MIKTTTYDDSKWQIVPKKLTNEMYEYGKQQCLKRMRSIHDEWNEMLCIAAVCSDDNILETYPIPPEQQPIVTREQWFELFKAEQTLNEVKGLREETEASVALEEIRAALRDYNQQGGESEGLYDVCIDTIQKALRGVK